MIYKFEKTYEEGWTIDIEADSFEEAKKMTELYKNSIKELDIRKNAIIHLCLHCGMRISEVSNLNISDFKLSERKFIIFGKGNKERMGYLNNDTYKQSSVL